MHHIATVELPLEAGGPEIVVHCGLGPRTASSSATVAEPSPSPPSAEAAPNASTAPAEIEANVAAAHAALEPPSIASRTAHPATSSGSAFSTALENPGAASSAVLSEAAAAVAAAGRVLWYYKDERQAVHGPFEASQLDEWFGAKTLPSSLPLRSSRHPPGIYTPLHVLVCRHGGKPRFHDPLYEQAREPLSTATQVALEHARVSRAHLERGADPRCSDMDDPRLSRDVDATRAMGGWGACWRRRQGVGF